MLLDDLLNEVRVSGAQVRRGRLIELKLKPPPQVGGVKDVIPAPAHRWGPGPVYEWQMLEDLQDHVVGQVTPVLCWRQGEAGRPPLLSLGPLLMGRECRALWFETCPSTFHSETNQHIVRSGEIRNYCSDNNSMCAWPHLQYLLGRAHVNALSGCDGKIHMDRTYHPNFFFST